MACLVPVMCKCVWLMIAVVSVCSLGEEYVSGCLGEVGKTDIFSAVVICIICNYFV